MRVALELKDFAKYPFLKESQQFIGNYADTIEDFIKSNAGKIALRHARDRVKAALSGEERSFMTRLPPQPTDNFGVKMAVSSYALARILASCSKDRALIERLVRYEAARAYFFIIEEEENKRDFIAGSVGVDSKGLALPVTQYIEITAGLHEERWRLVNRDVGKGLVVVNRGEMNELIREQIRVILNRQLPLKVPDRICDTIKSYVDELQTAYQQRILEQFGEVDDQSFPPCITALIAALTGGINITHSGRFALTAFLHNIGMGTPAIIELYCRAPDFDIAKTQYQVEHISGRGGTEYTAPSCAGMRTYGLCVKSDSLCEKINHPLNYYRIKKKREKQAGVPT